MQAIHIHNSFCLLSPSGVKFQQFEFVIYFAGFQLICKFVFNFVNRKFRRSCEPVYCVFTSIYEILLSDSLSSQTRFKKLCDGDFIMHVISDDPVRGSDPSFFFINSIDIF